jgi:hypothetical protein
MKYPENMKYPEEIKREIILECPHCKDPIIIEKLNCAIFRHGTDRATGQQIHPHLPKEDCMRLIAEKRIYGCGLPFRIIQNNERNYIGVKCDFI